MSPLQEDGDQYPLLRNARTRRESKPLHPCRGPPRRAAAIVVHQGVWWHLAGENQVILDALIDPQLAEGLAQQCFATWIAVREGTDQLVGRAAHERATHGCQHRDQSVRGAKAISDMSTLESTVTPHECKSVCLPSDVAIVGHRITRESCYLSHARTSASGGWRG